MFITTYPAARTIACDAVRVHETGAIDEERIQSLGIND
jgi:hypothetical protein